MLTPNHVVTTSRITLLLGSVTVAILTVGPFQGAEQLFGLTDKSAHALAFGGLTAISFLAFPRLRRADLARAALILGAGVEIAQMFGHRSASIADWTADAVGILAVYGSSQIESLRQAARDHGYQTFAALAQRNRRKSRRMPKGVVAPNATLAAERPARFAERAAQHFPSESARTET